MEGRSNFQDRVQFQALILAVLNLQVLLDIQLENMKVNQVYISAEVS